MDDVQPNNLSWRMGEVERRVGRLEGDAQALSRLETKVEVVATKVAAIAEDVRDLDNDQRSVRRALYTFALSVVVGAVVFAFSVFEIFGR